MILRATDLNSIVEVDLKKVRNEKPTPSVEDNVKLNEISKRVKCEPGQNGKCIIHDCEMRQISVTTKKWRDRGKGRGYGYVSVKIPQFICSDRWKSRDA